MGAYFDDRESMYAWAGPQTKHTLDGILKRYVGANPPHPATYRAYSRRGILQDKDYRYLADIDRFFPDAKAEQFVYAWAKFWSDGAGSLMYDVSCFAPLVIWLNGGEVFRSNIFTERYADARHRVTIAHRAGWNHFVIRYKKTRAGFGGVFGAWLGKHPYTMMMPAAERDGQEGWLFTAPMDGELASLPGAGMTEKETGIAWFPETGWSKAQLKMGQLERIYGTASKQYAIGRAKAFFVKPGAGKYALKGDHRGPIDVYIGEEMVFSAAASGKIDASVYAPFGLQDIVVKCGCEGAGWGFALEIHDGKEALPWMSPCNLQGTSQAWIYAGPFKASDALDLAALKDMHRVVRSAKGDAYWRLDMPDAWVRMYNDNPLYGRWNYPLGVTIYGMLHSAKAIDSAEVEQYAADHVQLCCDTFEYALWDKKQYGGATAVHNLLSSIDSLDDCGSFGSCMLEVAKHCEIAGYKPIADYVADYIMNKQWRLPDGTFYRHILMHIFHKDTMWADDLYMSVPFLCRYSQLTGDRKYINDAAKQFLGFKKRLFDPERKIMSHVYDFTRKMPNGVPWGRANGWTIFSLSELLEALPANHAKRPALLEFFRELCEGYLALQDEQGMWHQVLTHPEAYQESSCTSMFAYAFARGVRFGWLEKPEPYIRAVFKAWEALNKISIDKNGNVYGVCRGSEFSFTPSYYMNELSWNLNDTHGTGIVLLAGVEVLKLEEHLRSSGKGRA